MDSYGLPNMGCAFSTEQSDGGVHVQPRRVLGVNELLNAASPPPMRPRPILMNRPPHLRHQVPDAQMQIQGPGPIFPSQNTYLPHQAPEPGATQAAALPFPQINRQHYFPWEARDRQVEAHPPFAQNNHLNLQQHHLQLIPQPRQHIGSWAGNNNMAKQLGPLTKACSICLNDFSGEDWIAKNFPYKCDKCGLHTTCIECLKNWFIDACRNESKMPPRCCTVVPLSSVVGILTEEQIELYKAKFEEWRTPDRFYCPVPTCSAFISPRLLKKEENRQASARNVLLTNSTSSSQLENNINPETKQATTSHSHYPQDFSMLDVEGKLISSDSRTATAILPTIACPACAVSICTLCRQLMHPGLPCPQTDIDPLLALQLEIWKIKRCPKCRGGVRRMFGCAHIECRCGAHFCFGCLSPINECDGQCEEDDHEEEEQDPPDEPDPDDLDGIIILSDVRMDLDLGNEPYNPIVDTWSCPHDFRRIFSLEEQSTNVRIPYSIRRHHNGPFDCQVCWKVLHPLRRPTQHGNFDSTTILDPPRGISTEPGWPTTLNGEPAWMCMGQHISCQQCPKDPVLHSRTSKYRCECSKCLKCRAVVKEEDKQLVEEEEKMERDTGYDCDCGMVVCGGCKPGVELGY